MKIGEIIQRVKSLYNKGVQSDDSRLSSRHIYNKMVTVRSRLIYQKANKRQKINSWSYQILPCIELIEAPLSECPCLPPSGCLILRSKYKLPKPITNLNRHLIVDVMSLQGDIQYSEIEFKEYKSKAGNKYTANKPDYFVRNGYIYITHKIGSPKVITLSGLFEDPFEVNSFPSFCGDCEDCEDVCFDIFEMEFPIDEDLLEPLIEICNEELVGIFRQMQQDSNNDSVDNKQERHEE